jgi:hypothetical protein
MKGLVFGSILVYFILYGEFLAASASTSVTTEVEKNGDKNINMIFGNHLRGDDNKVPKIHEIFAKYGTRISQSNNTSLSTKASPQAYTDGWVYINTWEGYTCGSGKIIMQTGVNTDICIESGLGSYKYYCDPG